MLLCQHCSNDSGDDKTAKPESAVDGGAEAEAEGDDEEEEEDYVVEEIINKRRGKGGRWEWEVRWLGYPADETTWEPRSHLHENKEAHATLQTFEHKLGGSGVPGSQPTLGVQVD